MLPKRPGNHHFRRLKGGLYVAFWVFLGILFAHSNYVKHGHHDVPDRYIEAVLWGVISAGIFVIFVPVIVHLFHRFPFENKNWKTVVSVHILAAIVFAAIHSLLLHIISYSFCVYCQSRAVLFGSNLVNIFLENIHINLLIYGSILRIHRSQIVTIERIKKMQPSSHGEYVIIMGDNSELTLTRTYRDNLLRKFEISA